ncbi:MAG: glycosyltransferase [Clostridia bacterium]|nr:glycosyltransferase [Clostridia bacterium]
MNEPSIAVLLPCYNEEQTIGGVVTAFLQALPTATVYVYDNNSTDRTAEIAASFGERVVVRHERQQGKGCVVRRMFREIKADCYLMADGDDTYPAEAAPALVKAVLEDGYDMAIGDRLSSTYFRENKRPLHSIGNRLVRAMVNRIFHGSVRDIMTGYRAFSYAFVKCTPILSDRFEVETEMTINALDKKFSICEIPVAYRDRPAGSHSKLRTVRDGTRVLSTILHMFRDYRPLGFYGLLAALLAVAGVALFIPVFLEYLATSLVPRMPTLVVSLVLCLAAMLSFTTGSILAVLIKKDRQRAQIERNIITGLHQAGKGNQQ